MKFVLERNTSSSGQVPPEGTTVTVQHFSREPDVTSPFGT